MLQFIHPIIQPFPKQHPHSSSQKNYSQISKQYYSRYFHFLSRFLFQNTKNQIPNQRPRKKFQLFQRVNKTQLTKFHTE